VSLSTEMCDSNIHRSAEWIEERTFDRFLVIVTDRRLDDSRLSTCAISAKCRSTKAATASGAGSSTVTDDDGLRFVLKMALRNALKLVKGLHKQVGEIDERIVVTKLLSEIDVAGYEIVRKQMRYAFGAVSKHPSLILRRTNVSRKSDQWQSGAGDAVSQRDRVRDRP